MNMFQTEDLYYINEEVAAAAAAATAASAPGLKSGFKRILHTLKIFANSRFVMLNNCTLKNSKRKGSFQEIQTMLNKYLCRR